MSEHAIKTLLKVTTKQLRRIQANYKVVRIGDIYPENHPVNAKLINMSDEERYQYVH